MTTTMHCNDDGLLLLPISSPGWSLSCNDDDDDDNNDNDDNDYIDDNDDNDEVMTMMKMMEIEMTQVTDWVVKFFKWLNKECIL